MYELALNRLEEFGRLGKVKRAWWRVQQNYFCCGIKWCAPFSRCPPQGRRPDWCSPGGSSFCTFPGGNSLSASRGARCTCDLVDHSLPSPSPSIFLGRFIIYDNFRHELNFLIQITCIIKILELKRKRNKLFKITYQKLNICKKNT